MQKFEKLILPLTFMLILGLVWMFSSGKNTTLTENPTVQAVGSEKTYKPKTGEMGAVMVEVVPITSNKYMVSLNTHSVDLDFDFKKIVKLKDDLGNDYNALSWTGERGGHHLSGEIEFPAISDSAKGVTIMISDIENEVLSLEWTL
jgi:hypothetical protein